MEEKISTHHEGSFSLIDDVAEPLLDMVLDAGPGSGCRIGDVTKSCPLLVLLGYKKR
jgi:hypothetical protein